MGVPSPSVLFPLSPGGNFFLLEYHHLGQCTKGEKEGRKRGGGGLEWGTNLAIYRALFRSSPPLPLCSGTIVSEMIQKNGKFCRFSY